ncbi:hypothetical protein DRO97_02770 [Archaeoglobales archaeon]|nr:MAG: hypothetical protein DRO97_02770 [Archaeoglobales archaeon]
MIKLSASERKNQVLKVMQRLKEATTSEIARELILSNSTVYEYLKMLEREEKVERIGMAGKAYKWRIKTKKIPACCWYCRRIGECKELVSTIHCTARNSVHG